MKPEIIPFDPEGEYYISERCYVLEQLNRKEFKPFSIARARVEPGVATALHALEDTVEVYYILDGEGEVELNGNIQQTVTPGDVVIIPAGVSQKIRNTGDHDLIFLAICDPRFTPGCYRDLEEK